MYCSNKSNVQTKQPESLPTATSSNISFIYQKFVRFRKSICLVKELFFVNSFIGIYIEEYYDNFHSSYLAKHQ